MSPLLNRPRSQTSPTWSLSIALTSSPSILEPSGKSLVMGACSTTCTPNLLRDLSMRVTTSAGPAMPPSVESWLKTEATEQPAPSLPYRSQAVW